MTCDLAARLPKNTFAFVSDSSCLMARDGSQPEAEVGCESIEKNERCHRPGEDSEFPSDLTRLSSGGRWDQWALHIHGVHLGQLEEERLAVFR